MRGVGLLLCVMSLVGLAAAQVPDAIAMYDSPVNLTCMDTDFEPDTSQVSLMWLLPNGDLVKVDDAMEHERVRLFSMGKHLLVKKVDDVDFGVYSCISHAQGMNYRIIQKGVNLKGPYWGDLTAKYRINVIVGAIAAAIVFILMIGICYCMNRNIEGDENELQRISGHPLKHHPQMNHGIDNNAMVLNDADDKIKTLYDDNLTKPYTLPPEYPKAGNELATKL